MDLLTGCFILASIGFILASISLVFTWKSGKTTRLTLDSLGEQLNQGLIEVGVKLEPVLKTNKTAMGFIGSMSQDSIMDKTLEKKIGLDMMGQYSDIIEGLQLVFPNVAEYIQERPEAITKLLPRLNTLITDPEVRKRLKFDGFEGKKSNLSRIWNDG